ncbi:hypothetical protein [Streptomyces sp. NBC_00344]|uniref:hypothetical protein n=1 Tax=Streptomyces sp. NBC_00344 TaxID=2975720 RepID=UPI002E1A0C06
MNANQQHMIDAYRAAQRGEIAPPLPGRHDWEVVRAAREHHRPARKVRPGQLRRALARVFGARGGHAARCCP